MHNEDGDAVVYVVRDSSTTVVVGPKPKDNG